MLLDFAGAGNPLGAQGTIVPKPTSVLQVERCIFRVFKEQSLHIGSAKVRQAVLLCGQRRGA